MNDRQANPRSNSPKVNSSATRAFGSSERVNHDSSAFYDRNLFRSEQYTALTEDKESEYVENPIPAKHLNRIFPHSSERMHELPDNSVHLMVTSPPYNVGKEYDKDLSLEEYGAFLRNVWQETRRVLVPGGRACINIANLGRKPYIPLHAFIIADMLSLGFLMRGEIIWDKAASASPSTAWGSWMSASNPTLRDVHEYILVFSKDSFRREQPNGQSQKRPSTIERDDFLENTKSVWSFPTASARQIGHPAPFPEELPARLMQLYTFEGEVVLDPFMGSGQTALAAVKNARNFVGYDTNAEYVELAEERLREIALQFPGEQETN